MTLSGLQCCRHLLCSAPWWTMFDTAPSSLSLLREGPPAWTTDAALLFALGEPLYISLTEGRPFPEAPIQARAATASAQRGFDFGITRLIRNTNTKKNNHVLPRKKEHPKDHSEYKKRGIMHALVVVGTLMAGVANLCMSVFTATRILRIRATSASQGWGFFPFHCQTWLQEAAGPALWPATIATGRQIDEMFS